MSMSHVDDPSDETRALISDAMGHISDENFGLAERSLNHSIELTESDVPWDHEEDRIQCRALTYNNLGILYRKRGEPLTSLRYHERALTLCQDVDIVENTANTLLNLCGVLSQLDRHTKAAGQAKRAIELLTAHALPPSQLLAVAYRNLAVELEMVGQNKDAQAAYRAAVEVSGVAHGPSHPTTLALEEDYRTAKKALGRKIAEKEEAKKRKVTKAKKTEGVRRTPVKKPASPKKTPRRRKDDESPRQKPKSRPKIAQTAGRIRVRPVDTDWASSPPPAGVEQESPPVQVPVPPIGFDADLTPSPTTLPARHDQSPHAYSPHQSSGLVPGPHIRGGSSGSLPPPAQGTPLKRPRISATDVSRAEVYAVLARAHLGSPQALEIVNSWGEGLNLPPTPGNVDLELPTPKPDSPGFESDFECPEQRDGTHPGVTHAPSPTASPYSVSPQPPAAAIAQRGRSATPATVEDTTAAYARQRRVERARSPSPEDREIEISHRTGVAVVQSELGSVAAKDFRATRSLGEGLDREPSQIDTFSEVKQGPPILAKWQNPPGPPSPGRLPKPEPITADFRPTPQQWGSSASLEGSMRAMSITPVGLARTPEFDAADTPRTLSSLSMTYADMLATHGRTPHSPGQAFTPPPPPALTPAQQANDFADPGLASRIPSRLKIYDDEPVLDRSHSWASPASARAPVRSVKEVMSSNLAATSHGPVVKEGGRGNRQFVSPEFGPQLAWPRT
ncbi:Tetratricopeptide repeat [Carpediemonas membranifera]|uniref:Tetratricopeptide repeat n=1 Tax=Carpediemonas membranifera TaxID=201153 RepID=A0A8J6B1X2_9EUKA|nr:Tetratricopeptide repeat [Carpediemonas membranifera]|eukprot:KAG9391247.1 Tetratricopeptide repeat [Carpediemonas membranifera]